MSLRVPEPPDEALEIIRATVGSLMSQPDTHTYAAISKVPTDEIEVAVPHRVYGVDLNYLAAGSLLEGARLSGWRYVILSEEQPLAVELDFNKETKGLEFSHVNDGPYVEGTIKGVRAAERLKAVREGDYELRLLEIPGLSLVILWLHAAGQDLLMPLPPAKHGLRPYKTYTDQALLTILRDAAARRLQFKDDKA